MRKVLYLQYTNPAAYPPLEHSSIILARDGWSVKFLGIRSEDTDALTFPAHEKIEVRQLEFCPPGWRQKLHYLRFVLSALWLTLRWRPSWIYASDPLVCPAALLLSWLPRLKVIYHEHDTPPHSANETLFMRFNFAARKQLARRAALCILPNEERAAQFSHELTSAPTRCVWNCPRLDEVAPTASQRADDETLWVLYQGSIVPERLPLSILDALQMLPACVKLRVIGYETLGHRGYVGELQAKAVELGVEKRVEFLGGMPRAELFEWCRKSDVGMAFMPRRSDDINMKFMIGASNKVFDYLACGLALMVADLPEWREEYVETGYALSCRLEQPESIANTVGEFLEDREKMRAMGERGRQKIISDWNYERQFAPVLERMKEGMQGKG